MWCRSAPGESWRSPGLRRRTIVSERTFSATTAKPRPARRRGRSLAGVRASRLVWGRSRRSPDDGADLGAAWPSCSTSSRSGGQCAIRTSRRCVLDGVSAFAAWPPAFSTSVAVRGQGRPVEGADTSLVAPTAASIAASCSAAAWALRHLMSQLLLSELNWPSLRSGRSSRGPFGAELAICGGESNGRRRSQVLERVAQRVVDVDEASRGSLKTSRWRARYRGEDLGEGGDGLESLSP